MAKLGITEILSLVGIGGRAADAARDVNPLFDRAFYAKTYPTVFKGVDLYDHYNNFGCRNGYDPNPYFDSAWYIAQHTDKGAVGTNPLDHYLETGAKAGRDPSPRFSSWLYLILYPDVKASGMNPLQHFLQHGRAEGRLAPPVLLIPSRSAMKNTVDDGAFDAASLTEAAPTIRLIQNWMGRLLDRIGEAAPVE